MTYFDDLVPDYTVELPASSTESLEAMRRLLYIFKLAINGAMCALNNSEGEVIALSPEFLEEFEYSLEEFQALETGEFFHEDSAEVAGIHRDNKLAAPYIARCMKKDQNPNAADYYKIQGLNVEFDGQAWRMLSFATL